MESSRVVSTGARTPWWRCRSAWTSIASRRSPRIRRCRSEQQRLRSCSASRPRSSAWASIGWTTRKGIPERLDALDALVTRRPDLRGRLTFVQIGVPSRSELGKLRVDRRRRSRRIADINHRHAVREACRSIAYYTTPLGALSLVALYRIAHFCMVSSLHDGMNLVAKEFVAARDDERACWCSARWPARLRSWTTPLIVNPYDLEGFAARWRGPSTCRCNEQVTRMRAMRHVVAGQNVFNWASDILDGLESLWTKPLALRRTRVGGDLGVMSNPSTSRQVTRGLRPPDDVRGPSLARALPRSFYDRPTLTVAKELLGKVLVHRTSAGVTAGMIVEAEAYIGEDDPACHAAPGPTARNAPLYGPPGRAYVYLNYGIHYLVNAVTEAEGHPAAVLIRALEPMDGIALMQQRRGRRRRDGRRRLVPRARATCRARSASRSPTTGSISVSSRLDDQDRGLDDRRRVAGGRASAFASGPSGRGAAGSRAIPPCRVRVAARRGTSAYEVKNSTWAKHSSRRSGTCTRVRTLPTGQTQLFIGLHLIHEVTTPQAFDALRARGWKRGAARPHLRDGRPHRPDARAHAAVPRRAGRGHDRVARAQLPRLRRPAGGPRRRPPGHRARDRP